LMWGFRHIVRCDRHGLWLADAPMGSATNLRLSLESSPLSEGEKVYRETPGYLSWLRNSLFCAAGASDAWLAGQTLEQVLAASEMLGAVLEHGHKVSVTKLRPTQTEEVTDIGFSIYCEGPEAVEEALDTVRHTSPATAVQAGPLAYYGQLFDWLDRRSNALDPGPIRNILRDHIVKHSAVEPGTMVLGVEITERRYHSLYSLSAAVGIERPRLSRLLKKLGEIPADATEVESGNMVFDVAKTVPLIEDFTSAVRLQDIHEYLGASQRQVEILYRAGIVKPMIPRTGRGSVRNVVFARSDLDELLNRIAELPERGETVKGEFHPVSYACQRGAGHFEDIFTRILDRRIPCFRHPDKIGIGALYVDVGALVGMNKTD